MIGSSRPRSRSRNREHLGFSSVPPASAVAPQLLGATLPNAATLQAAALPAATLHTPTLPAVAGTLALPTDLSMPVATPTGYDFPSSKLGQLLGFKGLTIQKVKEVSGVTRLHIHDKEKAKMQPSVPIEVAGTSEQIANCTRLLEAICSGDQTELGHMTTYVNIEPGVVGKCMGYKGTTVKQMTEVTGCYIEIQQDRSKGPHDTPRLFIAGKPDAVDNAVALINRFIASPGSKLDAVLGANPALPASIPNEVTAALSNLPSSVHDNLVEALQPLISALVGSGGEGAQNVQGLQQNLQAILQGGLAPAAEGGGELSVFEADGPKEERIIEVPARKKGHLLGLHGQTIEKIRQTSGVIKCHIMADRARSDKEGNIQVQIFGTRENAEACQDLVERVVAGDHSGIGHDSAFLPVEAGKVNRLRGDHWQVINALKDLTSTYLDILQGPQAGLQAGEAQLFIAGPPECVERAKTIVTMLIGMMDHVPANGVISPEALGNVLNALLPAPSGGPPLAPAAAPAPAPAPSVAPPQQVPQFMMSSGSSCPSHSSGHSSSFVGHVAPGGFASNTAIGGTFGGQAGAAIASNAAPGVEGIADLLGSLAQLGSATMKQQVAPAAAPPAANPAQQVIALAGQYLEQLTGSKGGLQGQAIEQLAQQAQAAVDSVLAGQSGQQAQQQLQYGTPTPQFAQQQPQLQQQQQQQQQQFGLQQPQAAQFVQHQFGQQQLELQQLEQQQRAFEPQQQL